MSKFVFNENMYGRKVKFLSDEAHMDMPEFYPAVGTIGTVVECYDHYEHKKDWKVQWPEGSTSGDDCWFCDAENVELIEEEEVDKQMTNEEIWEMLKPKMEKNGLKKKMGALYCNNNLTNGYWVYTLDDVHNAIALAYKVGYLRAMKGRSFKIGEKKAKKQGGHWEPVDPDNLPKEGKRVRYSRPDVDHNDSYIKLYDIGKVEYKSNIFCEEFGMKLDKERRKGCDWVFFGGSEDSLDMWVEDDE